ncbi:MAG: hypothetical protein ACLVKO_08120 [Dysgonomonas sp.]
MNFIDLFFIRIYAFLTKTLHAGTDRAKFAAVLYLSAYFYLFIFRTALLLEPYFGITILKDKPYLCIFILLIFLAFIFIRRYYGKVNIDVLIEKKKEYSKYSFANVMITLLYILIPLYFFLF